MVVGYVMEIPIERRRIGVASSKREIYVIRLPRSLNPVWRELRKKDAKVDIIIRIPSDSKKQKLKGGGEEG